MKGSPPLPNPNTHTQHTHKNKIKNHYLVIFEEVKWLEREGEWMV